MKTLKRFICWLAGHKYAKLRIRRKAYGEAQHWFYCQRCKRRVYVSQYRGITLYPEEHR